MEVLFWRVVCRCQSCPSWWRAVCSGQDCLQTSEDRYWRSDWNRESHYIRAAAAVCVCVCVCVCLQISPAVCFLLSPAALFISGSSLKVDAGQSLYDSMWEIPDHTVWPEPPEGEDIHGLRDMMKKLKPNL